MNRISIFFVLLLGGFILMGNGCSSDPNLEGAKLDLRNKDYDRALENVNTALERNPDNAEAHELKGRIRQEQAETIQDPEQHRVVVREMLQAYNRAAELDPDLREDLTQRLRLAYFNEFRRGIQAFNRGKDDEQAFNEAEAYFGLATEIQPDSAGAYVNRAFALLNAGRSTEAIVPLESAIARGDIQPETFIFLGDLYRQQGDSDKALDLYQRAAEIHPDNPDIQSQLLNAYVESGRLDLAMQEYRRAVASDPENKLYRYNLGSLLLESEDYDEAIEHLGRAVEIDPSYANAQYNLGAAYVNKAVVLSDEISAKDDELRAQRGQLSSAEIRELEAEIEDLSERRRDLFAQAVPPLERAKSLLESEQEDATGVCQALFSAYVQTNQQQKAQAIVECAGYEDMN